MNAAFIPIIVIPLAVITQFVLANRYDWRCQNCGQAFSLSPLSAALLPHSFGGRKLAKCPHCGTRSWAVPVPKQQVSPPS